MNMFPNWFNDIFGGINTSATKQKYADMTYLTYTDTQPAYTYTTSTTYKRRPNYHAARQGKRWK